MENSNPFQSSRQMWLMGYFGGVATLLANGMPVLLGAIATTYHLPTGQLGVIGTAGFLGPLLVVASSYFWINRIGWRGLTQICITISIAACLMMAFASSEAWLAATAFLLGAATGGFYAMVLSFWRAAHDSPRAISIGVLIQILTASVYLYVVPSFVAPRWGVFGSAFLIAAFIVPMFPMALFMPRRALQDDVPSAPAKVFNSAALGPLTGLVIMALYYVGLFGLWSFLDRIGAAAGLDSSAIGSALGISMLIGALAIVFTTIVGEKIGFLVPIIASLVLYAIFIALVTRPQTQTLYTVALIVLNFAWNVALPYQIAIIARTDGTGRLTVLLPAFQATGASAGPFIAGRLSTGGHFGSLYIMLLVSVVIAGAGYLALIFFFGPFRPLATSESEASRAI